MPAQHDPLAAPEDGAQSRPTDKVSRGRWVLVAGAILAIGLAASAAGALLWRATVRSRAQQEFQVAATDVGETLETLLRRDSDLVTTLRGVLSMQPHMSPTRFDEWLTELQGRQRQRGGLGTTIVELVPARRLAAFQARRDSDAGFLAMMGGHLYPVAAGGRTPYCLLAAGTTPSASNAAVARLLQGNWCDPYSEIGAHPAGALTQAWLLQAIADSGQFLVHPVSASGVSTMFIEAAFYRHHARIADVAQRRAALAGWVGSSFEMTALMREALGPYRGLGVALYHRNPGQPEELLASVGTPRSADAFAHDTTIQIDGQWRALVRGSASASVASADTQGVLVFLGGMLVSALLCALVLALTRSRERALGMVQEKTGELRHQALHDALTGLPNRVLALDRAKLMLARGRRLQTPMAALYVDIDGFKHVNDTFGHAAGDMLLQIVASRLQSVVREGDTAARLGGDEFVVLVEGSTFDASPELVAERLLEVLRQPYDMTEEIGRELSLTASIGIAHGLNESAEELLRNADIALYEAKATGRNRHVLFESEMQTAVQDRLAIQMDLAEALALRQLFLVYQPIFDMASQRTIGVEALLRWRHPTRGVIPPIEFIPIAEESGLIVEIGRWVLHEACRQAASWHRDGHRIGMSVNVSARQLDADGLIDDVRGALRDSELDPVALTLEITETTLMRDPDATALRLSSLKQLGVRISIDDFGTGYSSLAYLRQFPADALKIDRSFISGIAASEQSAALVHTLVQLGKSLGIETLAEGIEDQAQLETLQREHCDQGQGFLFSRPLEVDAIEEFLAAGRTGTPAHAAA
jgi:diguanylate cyclase (GGDEF)-like protein